MTALLLCCLLHTPLPSRWDRAGCLACHRLVTGLPLGRATLHCTSVLSEFYLMPQGLGRCACRVLQPLLHCTSVLSEASCRKASGGGEPVRGRRCVRSYLHLRGASRLWEVGTPPGVPAGSYSWTVWRRQQGQALCSLGGSLRPCSHSSSIACVLMPQGQAQAWLAALVAGMVTALVLAEGDGHLGKV